MMLEGKCPKCGTYRVGWSLRFPRNQMCPSCGAGLEIMENGHKVSKGYSPFTAEKYLIKSPEDVPSSNVEKKGNRKQGKRRRA